MQCGQACPVFSEGFLAEAVMSYWPIPCFLKGDVPHVLHAESERGEGASPIILLRWGHTQEHWKKTDWGQRKAQLQKSCLAVCHWAHLEPRAQLNNQLPYCSAHNYDLNRAELTRIQILLLVSGSKLKPNHDFRRENGFAYQKDTLEVSVLW